MAGLTPGLDTKSLRTAFARLARPGGLRLRDRAPRYALCAVLLTRAATPLTAQNAVAFDHLWVQQGLSQSTVRTVLQDSAGFMWFGTQDGLNRYDGYAFKVFRHDESDRYSLSSSFVVSLLDQGQGILWVGTVSGLNRLDTRTGRSVAYFAPLSDTSSRRNSIVVQLRSRSGIHWVGTRGGLAQVDLARHQLQSYPIPAIDSLGLPYSVSTLLEDPDGVLWVGTQGAGLVRLDLPHHSIRIFHDPMSRDRDGVTAMQRTRDGTLWVATFSPLHMGLSRLDSVKQSLVAYAPAASVANGGGLILSMAVDTAGALWLGTDGFGLYRCDPRRAELEQFKPSPGDSTSLSVATIMALSFDRAGALWIGTGGGGVARMDRGSRRFGVVRARNGSGPGLSHPFVLAVTESRDGTLWIGTIGGGLGRLDRRTGVVTSIPPRLDRESNLELQDVRAITEDHTGMLWVGTLRGSLYRFDPRTSRYLPYRGPARISVGLITTALMEDRANQLWIAGGLALTRLDPTRHAQVSYARLRTASAIFQDRHGMMWIGTRTGLFSIDSSTDAIVQYGHRVGDSTSLASSDVRSIAEDPDGTLWVGTIAGLDALDRRTGRVRHFGPRDGLTNPFIYGILVDESGALWLSTNGGIERFDPRRREVRHYDVRDGLQSNEFNTGAYLRGRDGFMYFGGIAGLTFFDPRSIHDNPATPRVALTEFKRFNRSAELRQFLDARNRLVLPARDNLISFEFSALSYRLPEKNLYAYRLDGFDRDWIEIGTKREATYTNLDPGSYTLRVKAANNDGVWDEEGLALPLVILPPWWKTVWFRLLAAVLAVGGVASIVGLRFRIIHQRNAELETLVEQRTAEIRRQEVALRDASRRAGMAEVATGVLHNIGNVFNGVKVSASVIDRMVRQSKVPEAQRAVALLEAHHEDLGAFLTTDTRGRHLPVYLAQVMQRLAQERDGVVDELASLNQSISHASEIISAQQSLARIGGVLEELDVAALVGETVQLNTRFWERDGITLVIQLEPLPLLSLDRHQFVQVLVNLLLNARQAVLKCAPESRTVSVSGTRIGDQVQIRVADNGVGIAAEHLVSIFTYGFTTRADGHGFGLHSAANAIKQMNGALRVESAGLGHGTTFIIELPAGAGRMREAMA